MTAFLVLACLCVAGLLAAVLFAAVTFALTPFARVFASKVVVGFGPRLLSRRVRGTEIELRLVPFLSSVDLVGANPFATPEEIARASVEMPAGRLRWTEAPRWRRVVAFVVAPRAVVVALPVLFLGPARTFHHVVSGIGEIFAGAVSPFDTARRILVAAAFVVTSEGVPTLVALCLCKMTSFAILGLPADLPFAMVRAPNQTVAKLRAVWMLVWFVPYAAWIVAWVAWALRGG
ncbi:MAG: hypothetical protein HOO96_00880 [Polyangiaceae bacterium]|nr:hypothetical protein [Polyangiaceae bacterium]